MTYKYFKIEDFDCQETGENEMQHEFILKLDELRAACGFPFIITSGYRSPKHSIEARKPNGGGKHTDGIAADILTRNAGERWMLINHAVKMGFTGLGIAKTFIHVDTRATDPVSWVY